MEALVTLFTSLFQMLENTPVFNLGFSFLQMYLSIMVIFIVASFIRRLINIEASAAVKSVSKSNHDHNKMEVAKNK